MSKQDLRYLTSLNPDQIEAVKENSSPLLINAGAGSGKTKVIASKIAYLIQTGIKPENILALTFTQKAAEEMTSRVLEILGDTYDLQIFTFHSYCNQFLSDNLLETTLNSNFKVIPDIAQLVFFARNINHFKLMHLQASGSSATAEEVRKFISRCKDESISLADLETFLDRKESSEHMDSEQQNILRDVCKMFSAYETYKKEHNMIDFGDMLNLVYLILAKNKKILKRYQEKYRYVLVDEFQDTNYIQLNILHLLALTHNNICVVGDDDQSIYRFRGAYVTNIKEFKQLFPSYKEVNLSENYRSIGRILEVANEIIFNNPDRKDKKMKTSKEKGEKIKVVECNNEISQTLFVVESITDLITAKCPLKEIAVLCRSRNSGIPIANELKKRQTPFEFIGKPDYFYKPIIKDLICLLKIIDNPVFSSAEMVRTLEREVFCLRRTEVAKLANLANEKMCGIYEVFEFIKEIDIDEKKFLNVKDSIDNLITHKNDWSLKELVYEILFGHDFYKYELQLNNLENVSHLNTFYKFVEEYSYLYPKGELTEFISYIDVASEFGLEEERENEESVKIMTVHSAKGKEFDNVFIIDAAERKFPTIHRSDKFEIPESLLKGTRSSYTEKDLHLQEERRLFYVAMTRAKKTLMISYPRRYHNNTTDSKPSRFLVEIQYDKNPNIEFEYIEKANLLNNIQLGIDQELAVTKEILSDIRSEKYIDAINKVLLIAKRRSANVGDIINNITEPVYVKQEDNTKNNLDYSQIVSGEIEFSASQFNTYERCPRIYQYHYIYKIPSKPKPYFDFGGTIHRVIEQLTDRMRNGETVDNEIASAILKKEWNPRGFESKLDEKQSLEEISKILERFIVEIRYTGNQILDLEKKFSISINDYLVNGVIDRIDSDGRDFVIVDYKTSKEPSSSKKAVEDIQLVLYTLAVEKLYGKSPKSVGWWFLRHDKKVMVKISKENTENVIKKIGGIVESIRKADFHPEPGWNCKNCDYKLICNDAKY